MRSTLLTLPTLLLLACSDKADTGTPLGGDGGDGGFVDLDGDGWTADEDCDDGDPTVSPGAAEACNGVDDDCDGSVDEGVTTTWYQDADGDGYGDLDAPVSACEEPVGAVASSSDCDDHDADIHPGAPETDCEDPTDYNCDGSSAWDDKDGDGFAACKDCDDGRPLVNPDGTETCDGVLDEDCDGAIDEDAAADASTWYLDADEDGYGDPATGVPACEALAGEVDNGLDCDDSEALVSPDALEICEGSVDEDCDGSIDEDDAANAATWYADADGDGFGDAGSASVSCAVPAGSVADGTDCDDAVDSVHPGALEVCDGSTDEDCDGTVDEDDASDAATWYADTDSDGYGDAASAALACTAPSGFVGDDTDCDDSDAATSHPHRRLSGPRQLDLVDELLRHQRQHQGQLLQCQRSLRNRRQPVGGPGLRGRLLRRPLGLGPGPAEQLLAGGRRRSRDPRCGWEPQRHGGLWRSGLELVGRP